MKKLKNLINSISWAIILCCFVFLLVAMFILFWYVYLIMFGAVGIMVLTEKNDF